MWYRGSCDSPVAERDAASSMVVVCKRKARDIEARRRSAETLDTRFVMIVVVEISKDKKAKGRELKLFSSEVASVIRVVGESCSVVSSRAR